MVSLASHVYAGRRLEKGDGFEARGRQDAKLLRALGRAEPAPPLAVVIEPRAEAPFIPPIPVVAEPAPVIDVPLDPGDDPDEGDEPEAQADGSGIEISPRTGKPKRQYKRRDLTAED